MRAVFAVLMLCVASTYAVDVSAIHNTIHNTVTTLIQTGVQAMLTHFMNLLGGFRGVHVQQVLTQVATFVQSQMPQIQAQLQMIQNIVNQFLTTGKPNARIMDHINEVLNHSQQLLATVANQLIAGILTSVGIGANPRIFSTIGSIFGTVVDTVVTGVSNTVSAIGTAVGTVVTGVIETAQPHVDNLLTELQGHAENAIQSVTNTIAGINQGLGY